MKQKIIFLLLTALLFTGCGIRETQAVQEDESETETVVASEEMMESQPVEEKTLWTKDARSSVIQEDEDYFYLCSVYRITKVDRANESCEILWENAEEFKNVEARLYTDGEGLLLGDKLYFIEAWTDDAGMQQKALSVVTTDGTGYQRLNNLTDYYDSAYVFEDMVVEDGYLTIPTKVYVDGVDSKAFCYSVYEDGSLSDVMEMVVLEAENPVGEEMTLQAENDRYHLCSFYDGEERKLTLLNKDTREACWTVEYPYDDSVECMDDTYAYVERYVGPSSVRYDKISLATGERTQFFERSTIQMRGLTSQYLMDPVIREGYFYYVDFWEYCLYVMRRNVENPEIEEIVGDAFFDTGIANVGGIVGQYDLIYSNSMPDHVIATVNLEWLQVNAEFPGAEAINQYLEECQNENYEYELRSVEWMHEMTEEELGGYYLKYSYDSYVDKIHYFDGKYVSFCQYEYDYTGGAHGMPYLIGFTFDLETGERLMLSDIISNTEDELKDIVTQFFVKMMEEHPEVGYWDDSEEYIRGITDMDALFYLTEEGITFYVGPYAISSYAAGFQEVTIPYHEFDIKIKLDK